MVGKLILKLYKVFLWFWGFFEGEMITTMLRRQKTRLGKWYVPFMGASILAANLLLVKHIKEKKWGWVIFWSLFDALLIWLIPHIYGVW